MTTSTITAAPAGTFSVDPSHSRVEFSVKHLGIATVKGTFGSFEGTLELGDDLSRARAAGTVEAASIDTQEDKRDAHLRSADFFDVERFPTLSFESSRIEPLGDDAFEITGDLTIRGVTREVTLLAEVQGAETDPWGNERVGLEVSGQLNRGEFGLTWNQVLGSGNMLVSDKVKLALEISAVRQG